MNKTSLAASGLIIGCLFFGLGSLIVKVVPISSYAIAFWRMAIGFVIFSLMMVLFKQRFPKSKKAIGYAILAGIFLAIDLAFWHESIHAVGPGISTLLNSLQIFFLTAIGFFFFKEIPRLIQILSLLLAFAGVALIAGNEFSTNSNAGWGFFMGLTSGLMVAASMTCIRKVHLHEITALIPLMMLINLSGSIVLLPLAITDKPGFIPQGIENWVLIALYGIVIQCFGWTMIAYAIPYLSLVVTGLLMLTEPIAALVIDAVILHKYIGMLQWCGAALTLFAIYVGSLKRKA